LTKVIATDQPISSGAFKPVNGPITRQPSTVLRHKAPLTVREAVKLRKLKLALQAKVDTGEI